MLGSRKRASAPTYVPCPPADVSYSGKVALVTGGARGIGRAYADAVAARGATAILADVDLSAAEETAADLVSHGGNAVAVHCDVADADSVTGAVQAAAQVSGRIDILVNNAGLHLAAWNQPVTELTSAKWRQLLDVNVLGVIQCAAACRPFLASAGAGVILNVSSLAGYTSTTAYGVSKLAVRGLTVALAHELASDRIRVVGIAPTAVESESVLNSFDERRWADMFARQWIKRPGTVEDVVALMLFLTSGDAGFITGETVVIGGGYGARV